jgi:hypothetical protein
MNAPHCANTEPWNGSGDLRAMEDEILRWSSDPDLGADAVAADSQRARYKGGAGAQDRAFGQRSGERWGDAGR